MNSTANTEVQPEHYLPGADLGMQAMLGTEGLPAGKIILAYFTLGMSDIILILH